MQFECFIFEKICFLYSINFSNENIWIWFNKVDECCGLFEPTVPSKKAEREANQKMTFEFQRFVDLAVTALNAVVLHFSLKAHRAACQVCSL